MRKTGLIILLALLVGGSGKAAPIGIGQVNGQVWYTPPQGGAALLSPNSTIEPGTIVTNVNGEVYASPFPGTHFRLAAQTRIDVMENESWPTPNDGHKTVMRIVLKEGKFTGYIAPSVEGQCLYCIQLAGGRLCMEQGIFTICIHGDGAHLYIAAGHGQLYPAHGTYRDSGIHLKAHVNLAILDKEGNLAIRPMTEVAPGMSTCLLSGVTPEIARQLEAGLPRVANLPGGTKEVSPSH